MSAAEVLAAIRARQGRRLYVARHLHAVPDLDTDAPGPEVG